MSMRKAGVVVVFLVLLQGACLCSAHLAESTSAPLSDAKKTQIRASYLHAPIAFEENRGQFDPAVRFVARTPGFRMCIMPNEIAFMLRPPRETGGMPHTSIPPVVRMHFTGDTPGSGFTGMERLSGYAHYFIGNNPEQWHTKIPRYARVGYHGVYPGIDLVVYGTRDRLEYDFVVAPGADPGKIVLSFSGPDDVTIEKDGSLALRTATGTIVQHPPTVYQILHGTRQSIKGRYVIRSKNFVGFEVAAYDPAIPLVIDPQLTYSTYLGGSNLESGNDIAVDADGNIYITGTTLSANFPTANAIQGVKGIAQDAFVSKLDADGFLLLYSTYIGGGSIDEAFGICVDDNDNVYITGRTISDNFPTTAGVRQDTLGGNYDAFVTRIDATGAFLTYSTYLGGSAIDEGTALAVDADGRVFVTGYTVSNDFPTAGTPAQGAWGGGNDAFVAKVDETGASLVYSTFLGGSSNDYGRDIAIDASGNAYITGTTSSGDFPKSVAAYQDTLSGGSDVFITKLNEAGAIRTYSTYLGGTFDDFGQGIAVDPDGRACVTGSTLSDDFPTSLTAFSKESAGGRDAFVTKLNASGTALLLSTYLGGASDDEAYDITLDDDRNIYITGSTLSANFPLQNPIQAIKSGPSSDAFISVFDDTGAVLGFSTYLGGTLDDAATGITLDSSKNAYVTGRTLSTDFPIAGTPYQVNSGGTQDVFVVKYRTVDPGSTAPPADSGGSCFIGTVLFDGIF
jgi:hypothetical protein